MEGNGMYRILILNGEVEARSVLFDTLQEFDEEFELYEAKKKEEAQQIIHGKNIQIVITDFQMNIQEFYESLPYLDVIMIGTSEEIAKQSQKVFMPNIHYVLKPVQKLELKRKITEALRRIYTKNIDGEYWEKETEKNEGEIEQTTFNEKEDLLLRELVNVISLKNGEALRERLENILDTYRGIESQYPFYVRSMCMGILQHFVRIVPVKMSENEKLAEYILGAKEFSKIENLLRTYVELVIDEFENEASSSNRVIYQVKQYIDLHYHEDLKLSNLAEQVYLSSNYLSNIFTKHTGCSLNKYIKEVRLTKAQEFLLTTNMKIADVGRRVGYDNTSYFIKKFQEKYGMTPEKYRMRPIEQEEAWNRNE